MLNYSSNEKGTLAAQTSAKEALASIGSNMMAATESSAGEDVCMDSGGNMTEKILVSVINDITNRSNIQSLCAKEALAAKEQELVALKIATAKELAAKTTALEEASASKITDSIMITDDELSDIIRVNREKTKKIIDYWMAKPCQFKNSVFQLEQGVISDTRHEANQSPKITFDPVQKSKSLDTAIPDEDGTSENTLDSLTEFTFDVVKKRKAMDAAEDDADDDSPDALAAFEDFELSVLPALEQIRLADANSRHKEILELEDMIAKGIHVSPTGGVYFAWSSCLNCMKIGATRRETPHPRLREISRYVTSPFKLAAWIPTPTPFRIESQMHAHFGAKRIRAAGAGTEFFHVSEAESKAFVAAFQQ